MLDHVRILASFPFIGPTYPRGARGSLREIVFRSCRIFYDVSETSRSVEILHVWHGAREEPQFRIISDERRTAQRCSGPGHRPPAAILAPRGPGRWSWEASTIL
ncbi:MAG: type II toxin-antitoxin system RelE/ParE family toxin [Chloroflexi bacterium]|nr:type II toxin-antitoxin system RelE/ParE family toxin [Chloroflexota bacterium]